jgi:hypothetical protein
MIRPLNQTIICRQWGVTIHETFKCTLCPRYRKKEMHSGIDVIVVQPIQCTRHISSSLPVPVLVTFLTSARGFVSWWYFLRGRTFGDNGEYPKAEWIIREGNIIMRLANALGRGREQPTWDLLRDISNGVHSASWVQLRSCLEEKVAAPVQKVENTAGEIRHADQVAPSIRKS